jgi:hypothetical protein
MCRNEKPRVRVVAAIQSIATGIPAMADRNALGKIGLMLGAATFAVMMIGGIVVGDHLTGRLQVNDGVSASGSRTVATLPAR